MENPAADQLPEAHSLPDGFVDSSTEPLAPSTPTVEEEKQLTDYKEEKLVELDGRPDLGVSEIQFSEGKAEKSENLIPVLTDYKEEKLVEPDFRPDVVVNEFQTSEGKAEKSENLIPVLTDYKEEKLVEPDFRPDVVVNEFQTSEGKAEKSENLIPVLTDYKEEKLVEPDFRPDVVVNEFQTSEGKAEKSENSRTFPVPLSENDGFDASRERGVPGEGCSEHSEYTPFMPGSAESVYGDVAKSQSSEKATEGGPETQAVRMKEITSSESAGNNEKAETSEVKRKNSKRSLKSVKEFLEFTSRYQQVLAERDAAITVRDKLESLCRELQRQNKMLMDECKRVTTEGQNLRLDLSSKFQDAIKEVSSKLEGQKDECLSQLKENEMLRCNLKQLADQYALSEQQYAQKLKQKTLELQIADLRIQQHEEKLVQEQSQMKLYAEQVSQLLATEKTLRLQLTADGGKFEQFQDVLVKSNEVFETFKQEIEKMGKSIKELNKENTFLKSKCDKSDITLIELVGEREHLKKQLEKMRNQKEKLESLCRSLQAERKQNPISGNNSDSVAA